MRSLASFHRLSPIPPWPPSVHFRFELKERQGGREWSVGQPVCLIPWQTCGESKGHPWKNLWSLELSLPSISPPWGSGPWTPQLPPLQSPPHTQASLSANPILHPSKICFGDSCSFSKIVTFPPVNYFCHIYLAPRTWEWKVILSIATGKYLILALNKSIVTEAETKIEQFNELRWKVNILNDNIPNKLFVMKVVHVLSRGTFPPIGRSPVSHPEFL